MNYQHDTTGESTPKNSHQQCPLEQKKPPPPEDLDGGMTQSSQEPRGEFPNKCCRISSINTKISICEQLTKHEARLEKPYASHPPLTKILLVVSTHLKNISQIGSFPQVGLKINNL